MFAVPAGRIELKVVSRSETAALPLTYSPSVSEFNRLENELRARAPYLAVLDRLSPFPFLAAMERLMNTLSRAVRADDFINEAVLALVA